MFKSARHQSVRFFLATLCTVSILPVTLFASIDKNIGVVRPKPILMRATQEALDLPMANRIQVISAQGRAGYQNLVTLMFDTKSSMETRWRAVTTTARIGGLQAKPELERALQQNEWFMRNAALIAMAKVNREIALTWAHQLLSDKALVVRASAVEIMGDLGDKASAELLWQKLNAPENFHRKQILFIRRRIVETLASFDQPGTESKFVELLSDADASLHSIAIVALERITKVHFNELGALQIQRERWLAWWREKSHTSGSSLEL